jgi:transcription initiation factor TFIIH subunit 2
MAEKDLRPSRYLLTLRYAQDFVTEFYEQNPISQLGVIGMRDGLAVRISDMSGNPTQHITAIEALRTQDPKGHPSLQNALDMSRAALFHAPSHGTREVVIVYGALLSSDPGDIHRTIEALVADKIRVRVVGLAAQVAICAELVSKTNGGDASESTCYIDPLPASCLSHTRV